MALALLIGAAGHANRCLAAAYSFTYSDTSGDAAHGQLSVGPSGLGDGSVLATGGFIDVTLSSDPNLPTGVYPLASGGPAITVDSFNFDNLLYPAGNAASGAHNAGVDNSAVIANPSYLTNYGLVFGDAVNAGPAVAIWGNGAYGETCCGGVYNSNGDYAFYGWTNGGSYNPQVSGGGVFTLQLVQLAQGVPEPSSLILAAVAGAAALANCARRRRRA